MTGIRICEAESKIINLFLDVLRNGMTDVRTKPRDNSSWIRSQLLVSLDTPGNINRTRVKPSMLPGFPQVIVCDYFENRELNTIRNSKYQCKFKTDLSLTIRIIDKGSSSQIGKLAGAVQKALVDNINYLRTYKISDLVFTNVPLPGYSTDDSDLNERQLLCRFKAVIDYG
jgi:hypothetical protein